jgi:phosphatidylinositol alpha-mannosyltransferase
VGGSEPGVVEKVVRGIDVYSCMSRWALEYLARDYGRTDGVVVPGGVDLRTMAPPAADGGGRAEAPTLLFSAALGEARKGLATLLEAMPLIAEAEPDVRLWLSGSGDPGPFLDAAPPAAVERTELLGPGESDRQHERYGAAWATCLPSTHDSFGMVLVESLACGTPVVVSTHGAPKELVEPGVNGELCEAGDAAGLAAAAVRALRLARDPSTTTRCRDSARPFDWREGIAPLVEGLYRGE